MLALLDAWLAAPFDYGFMKRALVAGMALSLAAPPLGVFLMLRGMSLIGDAMSHAILPGVALGFLFAGFSLPMMSLGGILSGLLVAVLAGSVSQMTGHREDSAMASFFLISLAAGVMMVSLGGSSVDLTHVLFGSILAVDSTALLLIAGIASLIVVSLAVIFRALVVECLDPLFLRGQGVRGGLVHGVFLGLVVLNLTAGFQTLGTLMAVGLMMLPATTARFWSNRLEGLIVIAIGVAMVASAGGLLLSYHLSLPSGPAIILMAGVAYVFSALFGRQHSLTARYRRRAAPLNAPTADH
ncbi:MULTISPECIES: metal ABC transporter permease [Halomonas]|uniref:Zinc ABC transporter permease n=1 Tax=Halomonas halophila TaxID=29573 RepID=A0ABQ0U8R2_9GAMM|nr:MULTISPECIES: metal ABC transporter permease [Halomonas]MDR5888954.1 metal ABC transporter permease [Halomonas salina]RAH36345.1 metal ABC transporter permease [Halomonas sp. SL1]WJY07482.1 metal ABC transporter permease [Halomonas halophila]GEK73414.1 zinc ABC transporter permease [Halomonas halophila]